MQNFSSTNDICHIKIKIRQKASGYKRFLTGYLNTKYLKY